MMKPVKTFEGQVNDHVFDNPKAMNAYIAECVENGVDITNVSSHSWTKLVDENEMNGVKACCNEGCECKQRQAEDRKPRRTQCASVRFDPIPSPYKSVEEYLVPFINEKSLTADVKNNTVVLKDSIDKFNRRLEYFNANRAAIDQSGLGASLANHLMQKYTWCDQRSEETNSLIKNNEERIKRLQAEIDHLSAVNNQAAAQNELCCDYGAYCEVLFNELTGESLAE